MILFKFLVGLSRCCFGGDAACEFDQSNPKRSAVGLD